MSKKKAEEVEGTVVESLPQGNFRVRLDDGRMVTAHVSGRLRKQYFRVLTGDRVVVEFYLPDDPHRGRISSHGDRRV